jgi:hypothetical protein
MVVLPVLVSNTSRLAQTERELVRTNARIWARPALSKCSFATSVSFRSHSRPSPDPKVWESWTSDTARGFDHRPQSTMASKRLKFTTLKRSVCPSARPTVPDAKLNHPTVADATSCMALSITGVSPPLVTRIERVQPGGSAIPFFGCHADGFASACFNFILLWRSRDGLKSTCRRKAVGMAPGA